jgi:hypothetical protein
MILEQLQAMSLNDTEIIYDNMGVFSVLGFFSEQLRLQYVGQDAHY